MRRRWLSSSTPCCPPGWRPGPTTPTRPAGSRCAPSPTRPGGDISISADDELYELLWTLLGGEARRDPANPADTAAAATLRADSADSADPYEGIEAEIAAAESRPRSVATATGGSHTGIFGLPGSTENDTSEYLNTNAPDFREVALGYADGVDFAPGYSAAMYLGVLNPARQEAQEPPEFRGRERLMSVTGVQGIIENWAFCSWAHLSTTDPTALSHMRAIANTHAMAGTNQKNYNLDLVGQAEQGQPGPLQQYLRMNCSPPTPWPAS